MNVEYLPFFEDEFLLRATDPSKWELLVDALRDMRESGDEETNIRGYATLLSLLSLHGEGSEDDLVPILARRFALDLKQGQSERAASALLALESAVAKYQFKEDCPGLDECIKQDELRKSFIEAGNWTDVNVAYEHTLQKSVDHKKVVARARKRRQRIQEILGKIITVPILVLLPLGLFLALITYYLTQTSFSRPFMIACAVLFSLQALCINLAFSGIVLDWGQQAFATNNSLRVVSAVSALVLCVVSIVIAYTRAPMRSDGFVSTQMCAPLALCQVFVGLVDWSLLRDFSHVRALSRRSINNAED